PWPVRGEGGLRYGGEEPQWGQGVAGSLRSGGQNGHPGRREGDGDGLCDKDKVNRGTLHVAKVKGRVLENHEGALRRFSVSFRVDRARWKRTALSNCRAFS